MSGAPGEFLLFYDGVCGLCDRAVRYVLRHDHEDRFRFASLQSQAAAVALARHGLDPTRLDTLVLVEATPAGESALTRGDAIARLLEVMGRAGWLVWLIRHLPAPLVRFGYNLVARTRYAVFGRTDACPLPPAEHRHKFMA